MDLSDSAKGLAGLLRSPSNPQSFFSKITNIQFDFKKKKNKVCVHIEASLLSPPEFEIDYSLLDFNDTFKQILKEHKLNALDIQAIDNLFQAKLVDYLLVQAIKKGMQKIHSLSAQVIYLQIKEDQEDPDKVVKDCIKYIMSLSNQILQDINAKHQRILEVMKKFNMEVYERGPLISRSIEELTDNLHRKFILIINQIIELQRGHSIADSQLAGQVKALINSL